MRAGVGDGQGVVVGTSEDGDDREERIGVAEWASRLLHSFCLSSSVLFEVVIEDSCLNY